MIPLWKTAIKTSICIPVKELDIFNPCAGFEVLTVSKRLKPTQWQIHAMWNPYTPLYMVSMGVHYFLLCRKQSLGIFDWTACEITLHRYFRLQTHQYEEAGGSLGLSVCWSHGYIHRIWMARTRRGHTCGYGDLLGLGKTSRTLYICGVFPEINNP